jgi:hypothetical protein
MQTTARWLNAVAAVSFAFSGTLPAQVLSSTAPDRSCNCRIELEKIAQLGRVEDTIAILQPTRVARDSRGRFYAAGILPYSGIAIFEPDGRLATTIGRRGQGPGEFRRIRTVRIGPGDSLFVHEDTRMTVLGPPYEYARMVNMPAGPRAFRFIVLGDGSVVLNNWFPTHRAFVFFDRHHRQVREFGRTVNGDRFGSDDLMSHSAPIDSGRIVTAAQNHTYLVQVWDTTGRLVREVRRQPAWFPPYKREERMALGFASRYPIVLDVHADTTERRFWTAAVVPDPGWKEPACRPRHEIREGSNCAPIPIRQRPRAYDLVLEVLDMNTLRPLISQRFDEPIDSFVEGGLMYHKREDENGLMVVDVYRPRIVRGR